MNRYFLGIDQGTTGTTALLIDEKWNVVATRNVEHTQIYPKPGWVEHDPLEIWGSIRIGQWHCAVELCKGWELPNK